MRIFGFLKDLALGETPFSRTDELKFIRDDFKRKIVNKIDRLSDCDWSKSEYNLAKRAQARNLMGRNK